MFEPMNYLIVHKTVYRKFSHGTCVLQNANKRQTDDVMTVAELKWLVLEPMTPSRE